MKVGEKHMGKHWQATGLKPFRLPPEGSFDLFPAQAYQEIRKQEGCVSLSNFPDFALSRFK